jgi:hypothetical protein
MNDRSYSFVELEEDSPQPGVCNCSHHHFKVEQEAKDIVELLDIYHQLINTLAKIFIAHFVQLDRHGKL